MVLEVDEMLNSESVSSLVVEVRVALPVSMLLPLLWVDTVMVCPPIWEGMVRGRSTVKDSGAMLLLLLVSPPTLMLFVPAV